MLQTTIGDLLDGSADITGYRLYVVKNGESEVLYVGQSSDVRWRIQGHIRSETLVGLAISNNYPQSRHWNIDLYTVEECKELIKQYFPYAPKANSWEWDSKTRSWEDFAEDSLIHDLAPRYNQDLNLGGFHSTPFTTRKIHPELQEYIDARVKAKREAESKRKQEWEEQQDILVKSVCTICGEHDKWQHANGEPCGVIDSVTISSVKNPEERITIPLVCRDCNTIINSLRELEKEADRVQKVKDAIEKRRIEASILAAHS